MLINDIVRSVDGTKMDTNKREFTEKGEDTMKRFQKCERPGCNLNRLEWTDGEGVCDKCGAAYVIELVGYYEEGGNERIENI